MTLGARLHSLAQQEFEDAVDYLEAERPGAGLALNTAVEAAIAHLCRFPQAGAIARGQIRRWLVLPNTRWKYTIYYRVKPDHIRVLAITHQRRQPFYWLGRR